MVVASAHPPRDLELMIEPFSFSRLAAKYAPRRLVDAKHRWEEPRPRPARVDPAGNLPLNAPIDLRPPPG